MVLEEYKKKILEKVQELFEQNKLSEINLYAKKLRKELNLPKEAEKLAKKILKDYQNKLQTDFVKKYTKVLLDKELETIVSSFDTRVIEQVKMSIRLGEENKAYIRVKRLNIIANRYLKTVVETAKFAISSAEKMNDATQAGIEYFRYTGPGTNIRTFCSNNLNKIFSLKEIEKLDNRQGLPVQYYCGGWNCRHRWVAVQGKKDDGVFIHKTWDIEYNKFDKDTKANSDKELKTGKEFTKLFSGLVLEYKGFEKNKGGGGVDVIANGVNADVKNLLSKKPDQHRKSLSSHQHQGDVFLVALENGSDDIEDTVFKIKDWKERHKDKTIYLYDKKTNYKEKI